MLQLLYKSVSAADLMERGSNLNIPDFWKGALLYYAVCNNNLHCIEMWVQLGTTANNQGTHKYDSVFNGCSNGRTYFYIYLNIL